MALLFELKNVFHLEKQELAFPWEHLAVCNMPVTRAFVCLSRRVAFAVGYRLSFDPP